MIHIHSLLSNFIFTYFIILITFKFRKKGIVRSIGASIRDFFKLDIANFIERFKVLFYLKKDPYDIYDGLVKESHQNQFKWHFLFQLSNYSIKSKNVSYNKIKYPEINLAKE